MTTKSKNAEEQSTPLPAGRAAPQFALRSTPDQQVCLQDFAGRNLIVAFYPADWSPVCGDQLALYNELLDEFRRYSADLIGISVDGIWCHLAYSQHRKLRFPLLSDFEPKGRVAQTYGAYRSKDGVCERALFVIDAKGFIRWSYVAPLGVNPGADGILSALESLNVRKTTSRGRHAPSVQHATAHPASR
jgi:peroxiredoxin